MDFENFIPLIFILIWIVSLVKKAKSASKTQGAKQAQKPGGLKQGLENFITRIRDEIEESNKIIREEKAGHEANRYFEQGEQDVRDQGSTGFFEQETKTPREPEVSEYENDDMDFPPPIPKEKVKNAVVPGIRSTSQPAARMEAGKIKKEVDAIEDLRKNLQKAIIWSEILAPPVSLRE